MCGRYSLARTPDEVQERFTVDPKAIEALKKELRQRYNIGPGQHNPVIILNNKGERTIELMRWGYLPFWAKELNEGYRYINARDDSVFNKPTWKKAILNSRCIIPASSYFEWVKDGAKKYPFVHRLKEQDLFGFAGIWSKWNDAEGMEWHTFAIITTKPNKEASEIHDRMPVILHKEDEDRWLDPSNNTEDSIADILRPIEDGSLDIYETSTDVNTTKNDDEHLILPINSK